MLARRHRGAHRLDRARAIARLLVRDRQLQPGRCHGRFIERDLDVAREKTGGVGRVLHRDRQRRDLPQGVLVARIDLQDSLEVFDGALAIVEPAEAVRGALGEQRDPLASVAGGRLLLQPVTQHPIEGLGVAGQVEPGAQQRGQTLERALVVRGVLQHLEVGSDRLVAVSRALVERPRLGEEGRGVRGGLHQRAQADQRARLAEGVAGAAGQAAHADHRLETVGVPRENASVDVERLADLAAGLLLERALEVEIDRQPGRRQRQVGGAVGARVGQRVRRCRTTGWRARR